MVIFQPTASTVERKKRTNQDGIVARNFNKTRRQYKNMNIIKKIWILPILFHVEVDFSAGFFLKSRFQTFFEKNRRSAGICSHLIYKTYNVQDTPKQENIFFCFFHVGGFFLSSSLMSVGILVQEWLSPILLLFIGTSHLPIDCIFVYFCICVFACLVNYVSVYFIFL